jgi:hypothetical protein
MGSAGPICPNLFTLLVGPPASGKSNAIRPIRDLWSSIKQLNLSPDSLTRASLIDALSRAIRTVLTGGEANIFSSMAVSCPEFGVLLNNHDLEFLSVINYIWDNPDSYIEERRTLGKIEITKPGIGGKPARFPQHPLARNGLGYGVYLSPHYDLCGRWAARGFIRPQHPQRHRPLATHKRHI